MKKEILTVGTESKAKELTDILSDRFTGISYAQVKKNSFRVFCDMTNRTESSHQYITGFAHGLNYAIKRLTVYNPI